MSLLGLYNWDNTLFDLAVFPEALERNTVIMNLLAETSELEVLYPNPVVMKNLMAIWSAKQLPVWEKLYSTTQYSYDPIENYNRMETGTESGTGTATRTGTDGRTETIQDGGSETTSSNTSLAKTGEDTTTGTDTKGHWKAAFDSTASGDDDGLVKETRDQDDGETTIEYGSTETGTGRATTSFNKNQNVNENRTSQDTENSSSTGEHTLHAHGNIGVTTTQQMIQQEREVDMFNIYDIIINDFKNRFCILVY